MLDVQPIILRAITAATLAAVASAPIGVFTVQRKLSTAGAAIAHTSFAGALLGYLAGTEPLLGALVLSVTYALLVAYSGRRGGNMDVALGVSFGASAALAALALSLSREYSTLAFTYLLGDVLGVSESELLVLASFSVASLLLVAIFYELLKMVTFDEETAEAYGVNVTFLNYLHVVLVSLVVVVELKVVGSILATVFLVAPAASALELAHSFEKVMILSVLIALASSLAGFLVSILFNLPTSAVIGLIASSAYLLAVLFSPKRICCR